MQCRVTEKREAIGTGSNLRSRLHEHRAGVENIRIMSLQMFLREHKKLQEHYQKHLDQSALRGVEKEASSNQRQGAYNTVGFSRCDLHVFS
jgi:hypothetical protein